MKTKHLQIFLLIMLMMGSSLAGDKKETKKTPNNSNCIVQNPSFENVTGSLSTTDLNPITNNVPGWKDIYLTPDICPAPDNWGGSQTAFDGSYYAGLSAGGDQTEAIGGTLTAPTIAGTRYTVSARFSQAEIRKPKGVWIEIYLRNSAVTYDNDNPSSWGQRVGGMLINNFKTWQLFSKNIVSIGSYNQVLIKGDLAATPKYYLGYVFIDSVAVSPEPPVECSHCINEPIGPNLVINPNFDDGNIGFTSSTNYNHNTLLNPGQYDVVTNANSKNSKWSSTDHTTGNGMFMVCDGNNSSTNETVIWKEVITIEYGKSYTFGAWVKNIVKPKFAAIYLDPTVILRVNGNAIGAPITLTENDGWVNLKANFDSYGASAIIEIVAQPLNGGGNDVGIDDICFTLLPQVPKKHTLFSVTTTPVNTTDFNVTSVMVTPVFANNCGYFWSVCELDNNYQVISGTEKQNPPEWWTGSSTTFKGYIGTSTLDPNLQPGVFKLNKRYRITLGIWCECYGWNQSSWIYNP